MIGYIDNPSDLSFEMLLGCLVDVGCPVETLRAAVNALFGKRQLAVVVAEQVRRGVLRAVVVDVVCDTENQIAIAEIRRSLEASDLPRAVIERSALLVQRLGPAGVTGVDAEAAAAVVALVAGFEAMKVSRLHAAVLPSDPPVRAYLAEATRLTQPEMHLIRIGVGTDRLNRPGPRQVARLWLGTTI